MVDFSTMTITEKFVYVIKILVIVVTVVIQSEAYMSPDSMYRPINQGLHYLFPNHYIWEIAKLFDIEVVLAGYIYGEYKGEKFNKTTTFAYDKVNDDDWDNSLPTLLIHGSG